jgi:glycosyltransferase involved in cell wall biosynthesis
MDQKMNPLVSVIVPTRDRLPFLKEAARSILQQTYREIEVFVVADGHQPEVEAYLQAIGDPRIEYVATLPTGRPALARNEGIRRSRGEFIAFCDDDDLWLPNKLERQIGFMLSKGLDFTFTACSGIDRDGEKCDAQLLSNFDVVTLNSFLISLGGKLYTPTIVVRRDVLNRVGWFNECEIRTGEDYELFSRILMITNAIGIKEELAQIRTHNHNVQPKRLVEWLKEQAAIQRAIINNGSASKRVWVARYMRVLYWALRVAIKDPWRRQLR